MTKMTKWKGIDTFPALAINYMPAFYLVYNPDMPSVYDEDTIYRPGINTGEVNYMRLSLGGNESGMTILEFIHNIRKTDDHVDEAEIVGSVQIHPSDMQSLINMLTERLDSLSS
jgi:hypothetical protein